MCAFLCVYVCVCVAPPLRCVSFLFLPAALSYNQSPLPHPVVVVVVVVIVQPPPSPLFSLLLPLRLIRQHVSMCVGLVVSLSNDLLLLYVHTRFGPSLHPSLSLIFSPTLPILPLPSSSFLYLSTLDGRCMLEVSLNRVRVWKAAMNGIYLCHRIHTQPVGDGWICDEIRDPHQLFKMLENAPIFVPCYA